MLDMLSVVNFLDSCGGLGPLVSLVKGIFVIIEIVIPIGLIIMGSIDLGKAVLSSDDKAIKTATSSLVKRAIAAVAVFFVVLIVRLLMNMVADANSGESDNGSMDFWSCWNGEEAASTGG